MTRLKEFFVTQEDVLECHSLEKLCGTRWEEGDAEPPEGLVFVHCDQIIPFFKKCVNKEYIVVSAQSDYGVVYQNQNLPALDYLKWVHFVPLAQLGYNPLMLPPRCDTKECREYDKFSMKMYSYTKGTFPKIPENIKRWYTTNCSIEEPNVQGIPFGVPNWSIPHILTKNTIDKTKNLYVNFSLNNLERVRFKEELKGFDSVTFAEDVPHEQYIQDLCEHRFVLSPPGNGLDCYRTWEALYCRAVPIVIKNPAMKWFTGLPICHLENLSSIPYMDYEKWYENISNMEFDLSYLSLKYWTELLDSKKV